MATILIVDDLSANRRSLVTLLRNQGHRLVEAPDGRQGLAVVRADHPDLIITDVLMPVMDGFDFVRQLRLDPVTTRIPVLFYTAPYSEREAREVARTTGVPYVLTKPARPEEVLKIVDRVLSGAPGPPDEPVTPGTFLREHLRLLLDSASEKAEDLRSANARLRALLNIGLEIASKRDSDQVLQSVCAAACDLFGATYVTLGIVDTNDQTVRRFVTYGTDVEEWIQPGEAVPGVLGAVVGERRTLRGENPGGDPAGLQLPPHHPGVQAFLAAPITSPAHAFGWICLVGNEGRSFSDEDEDLVMALAGQVGRIYELEHEVFERRQAEAAFRQEREALRDAEERMRFALQNANVGIWDQDFSTGAVRWSEILEAHHGLNAGAFGGTFEAFLERIASDDRVSVQETIAKAITSGADFSVEYRTVWPNGTVRVLSGAGRFRLDEHGEPVRGLGIALDVTQRRLLEAQYQQAQKMEAIGRLAGGVAHDFNNLLTSILGHCELLLADLEPDDPRKADITQIEKAGVSAAGLTRQLLAFSRKEIIELKALDLNAVVGGMEAMLRRLIGEDVKIVFVARPDLSLVMADRGQVEQLVMNLALNARDAMPRGGTLTIETANVELDEDYSTTHFGVTPGPYVGLVVTDTGTGMTPEVQSRLFEPFFTTKEAGKGTGLGLATVQGVVARSAGSVNVYSEVGKGTSVKVYLPRAGAAERVLEVPPSEARAPACGETVLVVEDAEELRDLTRRLLERQGYTVLTASDADEAVRVFDQNPRIDVLLTDVVMPGVSGPELGTLLIDRRPALRVIYMSGYTEDSIVRHGVLNPGVAFLHKPFTSHTLGRKLSEVLDSPQTIASGPLAGQGAGAGEKRSGAGFPLT
jgi:signal transduction histidine kinase/DNA-binding response OmpR family regulator